MRRYIIATTALLLFTVSIAVAGTLAEFSARSAGQEAVLEWRVNAGADPAGFNVQRSFDGRRFYTIATVDFHPGTRNYSYIDDDLFKDDLHTYYYRIEVVLGEGPSEFSQVEEVTLSFSGITRTWGSIKAMFR